MIRNIHQIWMQGLHNVPDKYKPNIKKTVNTNPNWSYTLWDSESIEQLVKYNNTINKTYNALHYMHQKIDFAKYIILYLFGGFYIDMNAYAIKNLDNLINDYSQYDLIVSKLGNNLL